MKMSSFTKLTLASAVSLVVYGYLCRLLGLNFFWESRSLGWTILIIGLIGYLVDRARMKDSLNKDTDVEKVGIGFLGFILFAKTLLIIIMPFTDAFDAAKVYLKSNSELQRELGTIQGFGLGSTGGISKSNNSEEDFGEAQIDIIVKGEREFRDITIYVVKEPDTTAWRVDGIE